ncbi:2OG-Fe(II) oxygenase [Halomonas sp. Y3]|uniref:2OG-Fe(II) oxygenase n=1 Tax=Halomonas sp. Y3 TaxID=2956797 RepID=UPI00209EC71A|nr:2OG-Fe(II) oxygenase [Halomonas sp. Y3]
MQQLIEKSRFGLASKAFFEMSAKDILDDEELGYLERSCDEIPKEIIEIGDVGESNRLAVGRFMEDKKGEVPVYRNDPVGKAVVDILSSGKCKEFFSGIMGGEYFIRRCQSNILDEGCFIGKHIDTYSNFEYKYSVVVQFGKDYEGGEFFVDYEGKEYVTKTSYLDVLVNKCEVPHGVRAVTEGKRTSLVFFLSKSPLGQANLINKQI